MSASDEPRSIHCPRCGYDLREQWSDVGATCPECGRFTMYRDIFPRVPAVRLVNPIFYLVSTSQLVLIPGLVGLIGWLLGPLATPSTMGFLLVPTVVLVNLGLAFVALPRAQRRQRPAAVVELAGVFFLLNVLLAFFLGFVLFVGIAVTLGA